jgi:copper homeostasis protein
MKFELCAASLEAISIAKEFNFDRIELCQNLEQGGTTPSYGIIEYAIAYGIDTHVLIRPRSGGFYYSEDEVEIMLRDILNCRDMGAKGVVIGALNEAGEIDRRVLQEMMDKAKGLEVTFHRAFDDSYDWKRSLDLLIECGVDRVLSSGLARNIEIGLPILQEMKKYAEGRLQIMAGGGVNAANISRLVKELTPDAIHFSGTSKVEADEESLFSETILKVDKAKVQRILEAAGKKM